MVQGVAFRYYTAHKAQELGLTGWIKNLPDGRVEIVAEGSKEPLADFEIWANQGPPSAIVNRVERQGETPTGAFAVFKIAY